MVVNEEHLFDVITCKSLWETLGTEKRNFHHIVLTHTVLQQAMQISGLEAVEFRENCRLMKGLALIESAFLEDPDAEFIAA